MRGHPQRSRKDIEERLSGLPTEEQRITIFGSVLRHTGLDELPQIINVLRGEMQLIGIRPMPQEECDLFPADVRRIYDKHKPGLFDVTLAPKPSDGNLEDKFERMRASEKILTSLEQDKSVKKIAHLLWIIYMRKITDHRHARIVRNKLESLLDCVRAGHTPR